MLHRQLLPKIIVSTATIALGRLGATSSANLEFASPGANSSSSFAAIAIDLLGAWRRPFVERKPCGKLPMDRS
jgi:hypothetical protein